MMQATCYQRQIKVDHCSTLALVRALLTHGMNADCLKNSPDLVYTWALPYTISNYIKLYMTLFRQIQIDFSAELSSKLNGI